ncbi:microtubule-associated protein 9 isoform X2 [Tachyglossus aculeatus]|uniref:microtubule-associated protein 9 isoform X2 n=1 Tax=Tachyglossus aculeatus TaxID=9261 RepID=UPI0018F46EC8|nr:microtubule-associated protein 9 isoform X2 [Tachyglossus aculeatus]
MSNEVFSTTLAYNKSSKVTKRTAFQEELKEVISVRKSRQPSIEYSDDFTSDEDGTLRDVSETSMDEKTIKKKVTNKFHLSDDDKKKSPKVTYLKSKKTHGKKAQNAPTVTIKNKEVASDSHDKSELKSLLESPSKEDKTEQKKMKVKPKPKPRNRQIKSTSSEERIGGVSVDDNFKPSPRQRSILRKSSHVEDKEVPGEDSKINFSLKPASHSAPSSLTRLNDILLESEKRALSESPNPEGPWLKSPSPILPLYHSVSADENIGTFSPLSGEGYSVKEWDENQNYLKLEDSDRKSPPVKGLMMTTEYDKLNQIQETSEHDLEETAKKSDQIMDNDITDAPTESTITTLDESLKTPTEDKNQKNTETKRRGEHLPSRSLTSEYIRQSHAKKKTPSLAASSQYLGVLKVLDNKPSQNQTMEIDKADSLRAAVYQEWLEKKKTFLQELQRIKRNEAEVLRIKNEQKGASKKEEALASFKAWKAMKEREAKKMAKMKKLEEEKIKRSAEETAEKKGEAQKAFEKWKEQKMEDLKEKSKKAKQFEREKKKKAEEIDAEKKKVNILAVEKWNEKKEILFKQKAKEKINEKRNQEIEKSAKEDKDRQALDEYERWLERKERTEKKQRKFQVLLENKTPPPWSPPSKTVSSRSS